MGDNTPSSEITKTICTMGVLETKLDILISDFAQEHKETKEALRSLELKSVSTETTIATIWTTLKWHTVIGTFMVGLGVYLAVASKLL